MVCFQWLQGKHMASSWANHRAASCHPLDGCRSLAPCTARSALRLHPYFLARRLLTMPMLALSGCGFCGAVYMRLTRRSFQAADSGVWSGPSSSMYRPGCSPVSGLHGFWCLSVTGWIFQLCTWTGFALMITGAACGCMLSIRLNDSSFQCSVTHINVPPAACPWQRCNSSSLWF
jgi:hypothetical protein